MSMTRAALKAELQAMLGEAAKKFDSDAAAFDRHLDAAALALARKTRCTRLVKLTVAADVSDYPAPADLVEVKYSNWGESYRKNTRAWNNKLGAFPRLSTAYIDGVQHIHLSPAPDACQIAAIGSDYPVFYYGSYAIGATEQETTVPAQHRDLLLIRAVVAALMELANSGSTKPVALGSQGVGSMPKNGTPAALAASWLAIFDGGR
jgi:hypothetical protein